MAKLRKQTPMQELAGADRTRCNYAVTGFRCRYPGTVSPVNWNGEGEHPGPWYCRLHWQCHSALIGETIADASSDYEPAQPDGSGLHPDAAQARRDSHAKALAEAAQWCVEHGVSSIDEIRSKLRMLSNKLRREL